MPSSSIVVMGTFDSKAEEHLFLKAAVESRGMPVITFHVGTRKPSPFPADFDLFLEGRIADDRNEEAVDRDAAIADTCRRGRELMNRLVSEGRVGGVVSAGGGTGTHLCSQIMHVIPLGVPKVMVSTVASRDMNPVVGTKDITMIHSVVDLLGVNSISGGVLDKAAACVCAMSASRWRPETIRKKIAMPFFGFVTKGAEHAKKALEAKGYEVVAFHANGTGGMAMEELAGEGFFDAIFDLATHELADRLMDGYCGAIGDGRFEPIRGKKVPRLVVPGGLDCAVLEFTRDTVPVEYRDRKIFFYDFRSAIRLNLEETGILARQLTRKINKAPLDVRVLIPDKGWSEADCKGGPLYDPPVSEYFVSILCEGLDPKISFSRVPHHINDPDFAMLAADVLEEMIES